MKYCLSEIITELGEHMHNLLRTDKMPFFPHLTFITSDVTSKGVLHLSLRGQHDKLYCNSRALYGEPESTGIVNCAPTGT